MNTLSNAVPEPRLDSQVIEPAAISASQRMYWSVRRELWENRAIYVAPIAVACMFMFGFSISILHVLIEMHAAPWLDVTQQRELFGQPYEFAEDLIMGTALLVGLFYSVDALYGERRDRSILDSVTEKVASAFLTARSPLPDARRLTMIPEHMD